MSLKQIMKCLVVMLLALPLAGALAQDATVTPPPPVIPAAYQMSGFSHIAQKWNNCGPATLTMGLTYFGVAADQDPAAKWLKPNANDGNVSPWQMTEYVNYHLPGTTRALTRVGGDLTRLKLLISNNFPVIIEAGYDPEPDRLGWMGHYLLVTGYDDNTSMMMTHDSYLGPNKAYSYEHVSKFWKHFNSTYIVLYDFLREEELITLLGDDADEQQNTLNALEMARQDALADATNAFAWFNLGTNYVALAQYDERAFEYAATAYDEARKLGLPYRISWYQFGMYEAYNAIGRYSDTIELARVVLDQGGTAQEIEETYYYAGLARAAMGERDRALTNLNTAIEKNTNFAPAREAREQLLSAASG